LPPLSRPSGKPSRWLLVAPCLPDRYPPESSSCNQSITRVERVGSRASSPTTLPPESSLPDHKHFGRRLQHFRQIRRLDGVALRTPPIAVHMIRIDDHIVGIMAAVDDNLSKTVAVDLRHRHHSPPHAPAMACPQAGQCPSRSRFCFTSKKAFHQYGNYSTGIEADSRRRRWDPPLSNRSL
jgi:hypothetical protein